MFTSCQCTDDADIESLSLAIEAIRLESNPPLNEIVFLMLGASHTSDIHWFQII